MLIPVILSGGSGTRLWPLSRELYPKQLLPLVGERTMLQETAGAADGPRRPRRRRSWSATTATASWWPSSCASSGQPRRRSSSSRWAGTPRRRSPLPRWWRWRSRGTRNQEQGASCDADPVLLVLPADHVIRDVEAFQSAVQAGLAAANAGKLVTFGVVPDRPETGYGYIRRAQGAGPAYPVAEFVEKPDAATAEQVRRSRATTSGTAACSCSARARSSASSKAHAPAILSACEDAVAAAKRDLDFTRLPAAEFGACPSDSIDYAVMEKTQLPSSCRSTPAGATSARGRRCRTRCRPTRRAT